MKLRYRVKIGYYGFLCLLFIILISTGSPLIAEDYLDGFSYASSMAKPCSECGFSLSVKAYSDPDKSVDELKKNYTKFAFDYTNKENPLLEKELFKILQNYLESGGMVRSEDNPDILITMNFYIGKKENYTPPQTITSTRMEYVWTSGMVGWTPTGHYEAVPITESTTIPGKTETSYYRNIQLNFLDYKALQGEKKPEIPPLIWKGEVSSNGSWNDIRKPAIVMLKELIDYYPNRVDPVQKDIYIDCRKYGVIGVRISKSDWRVIKEVIPGGRADKAGLKPGDVIEKINGKKTTVGCDTWHGKESHCASTDTLCRALEGETYTCEEVDPFYNFVIRNISGEPVKMLISRQGEKKKIEISVTPEPVTQCRYYDSGKIKQIIPEQLFWDICGGGLHCKGGN